MILFDLSSAGNKRKGAAQNLAATGVLRVLILGLQINFVSRQICNLKSVKKKHQIYRIYLGAKAFASVTSFNPHKTHEHEFQRD